MIVKSKQKLTALLNFCIMYFNSYQNIASLALQHVNVRFHRNQLWVESPVSLMRHLCRTLQISHLTGFNSVWMLPHRQIQQYASLVGKLTC